MKSDLYKDEFEKEIWLLIDGTMSDERKEFWENKMREFPELKTFYLETIDTLSAYDENIRFDLSEEKIEKMIYKATRPDVFGRLHKFIRSFFNNSEMEPNIVKLAFSAFVMIAALAFILLLSKPDALTTVNNKLLNWNDSEISSDIQSINTRIELLENENVRELILLYLMQTDNWQRKTISIDERIKTINNEINNNSL